MADSRCDSKVLAWFLLFAVLFCLISNPYTDPILFVDMHVPKFSSA